MDQTIRYILSFLLYGNESAIEHIAYVQHPASDFSCPITILGHGITGELHYPDLQEPQVEQLPNGHYVIHTDIIYNTFFFISRAEEVLNTRRDEHGRFLAQYSILTTENLRIPLIDEYSQLLLQLLNIPSPTPDFTAVHLTHDVDTIANYRHLRGTLGGIRRGHLCDVIASLRDLRNDPAYTFPWMIEQDAECTMRNDNCDVIYFIKHTTGKGIDYPQYNLHGKDFLQTAHLLQNSGAQFGIHSSAYANYPLPKGQIHRSHYLSCSIDRMQQLADAGYTDDYTMGFADLAGFRLQTTRPVRWINPLTHQLSPLTLHPLTIMDCTLSNTNYMHLSEDEAYSYAAQLIDNVRMYHGELNLLWHNSNFNPNTYHASLYPKILQLI